MTETTAEIRVKRRPLQKPGNGKLRKAMPAAPAAGDTPEARSRLILAAIEAFRDGDFSARLPAHWDGVDAQIASALNTTIAQKQHISEEVTRLSETVGKEGRLRQRMSLPGAVGD